MKIFWMALTYLAQLRTKHSCTHFHDKPYFVVDTKFSMMEPPI